MEIEIAGSDLDRIEQRQHSGERVQVESRSHEEAAALVHAARNVLVDSDRQFEARELLHPLGLVGGHQALRIDELELDDVRAAVERPLR
jgi:hypothetical protein